MDTETAEHRSLTEVVAEIRNELIGLLETRIQMVRSEWRETKSTIKSVVPLTAIAVALLGTAYLLFTAAIVALVAMAFYRSPYAWFYAFLIVGLLWAAGGTIFTYFARSSLRGRALFPHKTLEMLKADSAWIRNESGYQHEHHAY